MKYWIITFFSTICICLHAQTIADVQALARAGEFEKVLSASEQILQASTKKTLTKNRLALYPCMGKAYYQLYRFERSAEILTQYIELLKSENPAAETTSVTTLIERAKRAARMLSRCENIQIIDSVLIDKKRFLDAYRLSGESGFLSQHSETVSYENPLHDKRYFSEMQADSVFRIVSEIRLQNEWTDQRSLSLASDSLANDNFPFVMPDGLTLYFASNRTSSIGGYDLYVTRYNLNNDTWLAPNQLGMPFNSLANDYLMAIDETHHIGYFATDRGQAANKVIVYTFIPNEEFTAIETDDEQLLIRRAQITAIRDTWQADNNYAQQLKQLQHDIQSEQHTTQENFSFVINDRLVYASLMDFKNDAAMQTFVKSQEINRQIQQLEPELTQLRKDYFSADDTQKSSLRPKILSAEENLTTLRRQYEIFTKSARNAENKFLTRQAIN